MTGLERERRGGNGILNIRIVRCRFRLSALWILLNSFRLSLCRAASKESNPLEITVLQPGAVMWPVIQRRLQRGKGNKQWYRNLALQGS